MWLDVMGGTAYPVFDAVGRTGGRDGRLTYPTEQPALRGRRYSLGSHSVVMCSR